MSTRLPRKRLPTYDRAVPRRKRLTITLREELLRGIDQLIDEAEIRNRSHAIEVLLQRALGHNVRQAVILAAGEGVRLRPFTYELPKPLLPVAGRPLLAYTLDRLRDHGIRDVIVVTGRLGAKVEREFGSGERLGLRIRYVRQRGRTGTGGALRAAQPALEPGAFLCHYGDILADVDLADLIRSHESVPHALATLALTSATDPSAYGAVRLHGMRVAEFLEKPAKHQDVSHFVFAGISVFSDEVFRLFPNKAVVSLERDVFPVLLRRNGLYAHPFEGTWYDVSTTAVYERVLKMWARAAVPVGP